MCLETSLAWPIPPVNVFKFVMGVILLKINCKWMLKKTLIVLPTFLGQNGRSLDTTWRLKKSCSKLLVHQRHSLTNQVITPCWSQYSCLISLSCRRDARDTKWPRAWLEGDEMMREDLLIQVGHAVRIWKAVCLYLTRSLPHLLCRCSRWWVFQYKKKQWLNNI